MSTIVPKHKVLKRSGGRPADSGNKAIEDYVWTMTGVPLKKIKAVMVAIRDYVESELSAGRSVNWANLGTFKHRPWTPRTIVISPTLHGREYTQTIHHLNYHLVFKYSGELQKKVNHELPSY